MKELKKLNQFPHVNKYGTIYTKANVGWLVSNSLDCDNLLSVVINSPNFEESIEDLLEVEFSLVN